MIQICMESLSPAVISVFDQSDAFIHTNDILSFVSDSGLFLVAKATGISIAVIILVVAAAIVCYRYRHPRNGMYLQQIL